MAGKGREGEGVQWSTNSRILRRSSKSCSVVVVARTAWKVGGSTILRAGLRGLAATNGFGISISIFSR